MERIQSLRYRQIGELALRPDAEMHSVHHVAHPVPTTWNTIISELAHLIKKDENHAEEIPLRNWIERLRELMEYPESIRRTPAIKLLDFYEAGLAAMNGQVEFIEAMGIPRLDTGRTASRSNALKSVPSLSNDDVAKWLAYWKAHSILG
jgi:hypothetical protein